MEEILVSLTDGFIMHVAQLFTKNYRDMNEGKKRIFYRYLQDLFFQEGKRARKTQKYIKFLSVLVYEGLFHRLDNSQSLDPKEE